MKAHNVMTQKHQRDGVQEGPKLCGDLRRVPPGQELECVQRWGSPRGPAPVGHVWSPWAHEHLCSQCCSQPELLLLHPSSYPDACGSLLPYWYILQASACIAHCLCLSGSLSLYSWEKESDWFSLPGCITSLTDCGLGAILDLHHFGCRGGRGGSYSKTTAAWGPWSLGRSVSRTSMVTVISNTTQVFIQRLSEGLRMK